MQDALIAIVGLILGLIIIAVFGLLGAIILWPLWNWLMPEIFGLKSITYWQAYGLIFLCSMLFKSSCSTSKD